MPSAVVFQRPLLSMQYSVIKHVEYSERTKITPIRYGYQMIRLNPITSTMLCKESNSNSIYIYIMQENNHRNEVFFKFELL